MKPLLLGCLLILLAVAAPAAEPTTVEELAASGRLLVDSSLQPDDLVPGQRGKLVIEIATDRWFSGGTRIRLPEVPGLVLLQTEQFAANASETRGGQSWVIQRWTLDLYPQRAGAFTVPPLELQVKVNGGSTGDIAGTLAAPALDFNVRLPPALEQVGDSHWVSSPAFEVSQQFDRDLADLQVGDAFSRDILFQADDVLAMMLPVFTEQEQPGLAAYPDPPQLDNRSNRGQASAHRRQHINYLVERAGSYRLPAQEYLWWDTAGGELKLLALPAVEFEVTGSGGKADSSDDPSLQQLARGSAVILVLLALLWLGYRLWPKLPLNRLSAGLGSAWRALQALRKPGLPAQLNPGNSAGD